ncbi:MAG: hypothetical protein IRZ08_08070 [Frankia sp.]|nr:hypothetical protein [Frankia sp.]
MTTPDQSGRVTSEGLSPDRVAELRAELRKLNSRATRLKLDLHDLAEDLPTGWERILEVATLTFTAYSAIDRLQKELAGEASA